MKTICTEYNALLPLNMPGKIVVECLLITDESRLVA